MANNGADVKPNQGVGATNTSTTTNTAENTVGTATPKQNGLAVLSKYVVFPPRRPLRSMRRSPFCT